jgi:hypothetical protein
VKATPLMLLAVFATGVHAQSPSPSASASQPAAAAAPAAPERLGRLFLTPQQREDLDRRRQLNIQEAVVSNEGALTVNGQVARSGGKTTTWVNGVPENDAYPPAESARLPLEPGDSQTGVQLKIGESFDKSRGEVDNGLGGGRVTVHRRSSKPSSVKP